jgi:multiple sugar transport system permease protein
LANFKAAFTDPYFQKSFFNSLMLVVMALPPMMFIGYKVAMSLAQFNEGIRSTMRFFLYIPTLASGLILGLVWAWFLSRGGVVNGLLGLVGIAPVPWFFEKWPARIALAIVVVSVNIGGNVIMFSMFLNSIPADLKSAAMIDGANERQYRRYIQRPLMMPMILLAVLLAVVGNMQIWETIYMLTAAGGPEGSTASPVYEIFLTAFIYGKHGLAAAKGIVLLVVTVGILMLKSRLEKVFKW